MTADDTRLPRPRRPPKVRDGGSPLDFIPETCTQGSCLGDRRYYFEVHRPSYLGQTDPYRLYVRERVPFGTRGGTDDLAVLHLEHEVPARMQGDRINTHPIATAEPGLADTVFIYGFGCHPNAPDGQKGRSSIAYSLIREQLSRELCEGDSGGPRSTRTAISCVCRAPPAGWASTCSPIRCRGGAPSSPGSTTATSTTGT